jgi:ceramide glucosyltransferase
LGTKVAIAQTPVTDLAIERTVDSFFHRSLRWRVIHRTAISLPTYLAQALLNPWPLLMLAAALQPGAGTSVLAGVGLLGKVLPDVSAARALGCWPLGLTVVPAVAVKDTLLFVAWCNGLVSRTGRWRGNRLRVTQGSRLLSPLEASDGEHAEVGS